MMTQPKQEKSNLRKLAEYIYHTGHSKEIMATLEILAASGALDCLKKGDKESCSGSR